MRGSLSGVVFVDYAKQVAGPWVSMVELAAALGDEGIPITLVMHKRRLAQRARQACPRANIVEVDVPPRGLRCDMKMAAEAMRACRGRHAILHANSTSAARAVLMAALLTRRPAVWHLRNSALSPRERIFLKAANHLPRSRVVAVSGVAASVAGMDTDVRIVSNPVSAPLACRPPSTPPVRVGVVTNVKWAKGLDILIEIAGFMRGSDVVFDVYGLQGFGGGRTPHLTACFMRARELGVLEMLNVVGHVDSLCDAYRNMHITLSVTRRESFGRVPVEAMRAGVPILVPSDAGLLEATGGGRHATVYRLGDPRDAALKLREMVSNLEALSPAAADAKAWAERYDPRSVARQMIEVYESAMP